MASKQKTFLILDGNALLHRCWHSLPQTMTTADGTIVNAAYGFTNIVERMLETLKPDYMAVAWDLAGPTFRHEEFKEYKATREKKAQELYDQIPMIQEILMAYGIPSLSKAGFEADDILGTIATICKKKKIKTLIVTGDMDALQLVDDTTHGLYFVKGISETKLYDPAAVRERYGFDPIQLIDYKAMMGDPSDNIKGMTGIGEKGAKELIAQFGSIEGIFKALKKNPDVLKPSMRAKFEGQEEHALKMKRLVTIVRDVDLGKFKIEDAEIKKPDESKLLEMFRKYEFKSLLKKYGAEIGGEKETTKAASPKTKTATAELDELDTSTLAVAVESQIEDLFGGKIKSIALFDGKKLWHKQHPTVKDLADVAHLLNTADLVIGYDLKSVMHALGARLTPTLFDAYIASYLLNPSGRGFDVTILAQHLLNVELSANPTAAESVVHIFAIKALQEKQLKTEALEKIMYEMEMPLVGILYEMEATGIKLDVPLVERLSKTMTTELMHLTEKIYKAAGKTFNVNSPSQLAEVLFTDLKIPTKGIKRTKSGWSTAADELDKITDAHEVVPMISTYRELSKLISTYTDALPGLVGKDGRLHTSFNQTGAATGRLSSSNPNLQNIPIRTEQGRAIRKAFVADRGRVLIAADYSQIELRLAAIIAKDKPFIQAFKEGADIHTRTAAEVWDVKESEVTKDQRRAAKAINFGILYGMGPRNLARSTGLSMDEAKNFIDRYFQIHHAIKEYIDQTKIKAHQEGYVETLFGRKRYLPELSSGVPMMVAAAERMAINMPVQGTEADVVKLAMIAVDKWLHEEKIGAEQLLQVHDELVLEVDEDLAKTFAPKLKEIMESVATLEVPLTVDVKVGKNWEEMQGV